jgi:hypothetical protein
LAVIQSVFGIASGEFAEVRSRRTRCAGANPGQDGIDLLFGRSGAGNDSIREALQVSAYRIFPNAGISDE